MEVAGEDEEAGGPAEGDEMTRPLERACEGKGRPPAAVTGIGFSRLGWDDADDDDDDDDEGDVAIIMLEVD